jgi:branched-chain amino acid transport system permease protein
VDANPSSASQGAVVVAARTRGRPWGYVAAAASGFFLLTVPLWLPDRYVLSTFVLAHLYAAMAAGWDVLSGFTGRENFGYALFVGTGAYAAALLSTRLQFPLWSTILAGPVLAGGLALLVGGPALRLRGPYFALASLAAAGVLERMTLLLWPLTGGEEGVFGVPPLSLSPATTYYATLAFAAAAVGGLWWATRGTWGLVLRAIRANEPACEACGVHTFPHKMGALLLSAATGGLAGSLYAHVQEHVGPSVYSAALSVTVIIMSVVGGVGTVYGAAAGGYLLTLLSESLRRFGEYRLLAFALVLLPVVLYMPRGLLPHLAHQLRRRER